MELGHQANDDEAIVITRQQWHACHPIAITAPPSIHWLEAYALISGRRARAVGRAVNGKGGGPSAVLLLFQD